MPKSKLGSAMRNAEAKAAEGGLVNDRSGKATMKLRLQREKRRRR